MGSVDVFNEERRFRVPSGGKEAFVQSSHDMISRVIISNDRYDNDDDNDGLTLGSPLFSLEEQLNGEDQQIAEDEALARKLQRIENALMPIYQNQIPPEGSFRRKKKNVAETSFLPPYRSMTPEPLRDGSGVGITPASANVKKNSKIMTMLMTTNTTIKQKIIDAASDTLSIKSMTLSTKSSSATATKKPIGLTFDKLPIEITGLIVSQLQDDQRSILNCLYVNKSMYSATLKVLYHYPKFHTSYRLGQFVTSILTTSGLAELVKVLDLSQIDYAIQMTPEEKVRFQDQLIFGTIENNEGLEGRPILAGWRDWKYRTHPLYSMMMDGRRPSLTSYDSMGGLTLVNRSRSNSSGGGGAGGAGYPSGRSLSDDGKLIHYLKRMLKVKPPRTAVLKQGVKPSNILTGFKSEVMQTVTEQPHHPMQNYFLKEYTFKRDIPIGYVIHLLDHCSQLEEVNLSYIQMSKDFRIEGDDDDGEHYWSGSSRELDDFEEGGLRIVTMADVWSTMKCLAELKVLRLDGIPSVDSRVIKEFLFSSSFSSRLSELRCCHAGMVRRPEWEELRTARQWRRTLRWY